MKAVILCAGLGTRLRPITELWPKPAVPLLGQPLLRYTLAVLHRAGVTGVGINTHHLPQVMREVAAAECARLGLDFFESREAQIQGTGGGIRGLRGFLGEEPFVVWNGDVLFAVELGPIIAAHLASGAAATMVLLPMPAGERYAAVELDPQLRVRKIAGFGPGGDRLSPWHFTGIHLLGPGVFEQMAPSGPEDINRDVYPRMIAAGLTVRGQVVDPAQAYWSDLGTPQRSAATHRDLLFGKVPMGPFEGSSPFEGTPRGRANYWAASDATVREPKVAGPAYFASGCQVEAEVQVGAAVSVGRGARVGAGAALNRTIVLDGAEVKAGARWEDVILLPGERAPIAV